MAHIVSSLAAARNFPLALPGRHPAPATVAWAQKYGPAAQAPAASSPTAQAPTASPCKPASAAPDTASGAAADFRALFTPAATPPLPEPIQQKPSPTAESVFGPNPWVANPTGIGPTGQMYSYNPIYFATQKTAAKVAEMLGGSVVQSNTLTGTGGVFAQQQPNYMVQLQDGRLINPGLVASLYTHGYPQAFVDKVLADEIRSA